MKFPWKWKKVFIWYKVLIEISQEVEIQYQRVSELAKGEPFSIIDMTVCCTLRVSDQPSASDYLIWIGDTFNKTKVNK